MKLLHFFIILSSTYTAVLGFAPSHGSQYQRICRQSDGSLGRIRHPTFTFKRDKIFHYSQTELQLSSNPFLSAIQAVESPVGSLAVLAFVVLIHELGHFLAAKKFGMKISEFSIGFGPKLFSVKAFKDTETSENESNGIDFSLRLLPLGGYVAFPENYNRTLAFEMERDWQENLREYNRINGKMSFIEKLVDRFSKDDDESNNEIIVKDEKATEWWKFWQTNKEEKPFDPNEPVAIEYFDDPDYLQNRPWFERAVVLSGGVIFNFILAFTLYFGSASLGPGIPKPVFERGAVISMTPKTTSPSYGILNKGDVILSVGGFDTPSVTSSGQSQKAINGLISEIRKTSVGEKVHLNVIDKNSFQREVDIVPQPLNGEVGGPPSIGVTLASNFIGTELVHAKNINQAINIAGGEVYQLTADTASSLGNLLFRLLKGDKSAASGFSGPVGVVKMGADVVATNDSSSIIAFVCAISINLAVVNSLPLPSLDGGQLLFVISEAISGRKIDQRVQEEINATALLLLLLISLGSIFGDVGRLLQ